MMEKFIKVFKEEMESSYSPFHVIDNVENTVKKLGYEELNSSTKELEKEKGYYVKSNDSSIILFKIPANLTSFSFSIAAAHSDSPTFKIKPKDPLIVTEGYLRLNVEPYGGAIYPSFLDRPLSIGGRVLVEENNSITSYLFNVDKNFCTIPNLAIHFNRNINNGHDYNPTSDMIPLVGDASEFFKEFGSFNGFLASILNKNYGISLTENNIKSYDLFLYNRDRLEILGANDSYIQSPKLDNLASVYSLLDGFINAFSTTRIPVLVVFDNEEVGSLTRQGANSTFLKDTLKSIIYLLKGNELDYINAIKSSFMLSVDNAHALHPNFSFIADQSSKVYLNKGVAIKYNASQSYTTDGLSSSLIKYIASKNNIPLQEFTNRSDLRGGSTLGNISNSEVSLLSADIGVPELAMHSANELIGKEDLLSLAKLAKAYYSTNYTINGTKIVF